MGTIITRTLKDGTQRYLVQTRVAGMRPVNKTFKNQEEAKEYERKMEREVRMRSRGESPYQVKDFLKLSLQSVLVEYENSSNGKFVRFIPTAKKMVGTYSCQQYDKTAIQKIITRMMQTKNNVGTYYKAATVDKMFTTIRAAWRWKCDQMGLVDVKCLFESRLISDLGLRIDNQRERRLSEEEERKMIERLEGINKNKEWVLLFKLALETAARLQELVLAQWSEFDLERKIWIIPAEHCKTKKTRMMPLSNVAVELLREIEPKNKEQKRLFKKLTEPKTVSAGFHKIVKSVGLADFRFHDLRHEAISRIVTYKRNINVMEIMKMIGHSSPEMMSRYFHLRADEISDRFNQ